MELKHTSIPPEFLNVLPEGIKFFHKQDKEFLVVEEVYCPKGHSLMVDSVKIHHEPSIRISVTIQDQHGAFFIDAFWGSHSKLYSFIPQIIGSYPTIQASCPECGISLMVNGNALLMDAIQIPISCSIFQEREIEFMCVPNLDVPVIISISAPFRPPLPNR